jgi:nucleoside triphosphate diphosphatase
MTEALTPSRDIARLIEIMAALRTPVTGCPWDLEQTFATIAPYTIEEAYEVADAIARGDLIDLKDELGDLLLQVVYHARLAEEQGAFAFGDVVEAITKKMIRRHPHVFADGAARDPAEVKGSWERIKAEERAEKAAERAGTVRADANSPPSPCSWGEVRGEGQPHTPEQEAAPHPSPLPAEARGEGIRASILADIPVALPALTRAIKLQDKAAKVGFDWPSLAPVFDKLKEEIAEFEEVALPIDPRGEHKPAASGRLAGGESEAAIKEEFGDMLFVMANIARHLKLDPEAALRDANQKFIRRFAHIETRLAEDGKTPNDSSLAEMDALWDEAKAIDKRA